MPTLLKKASLFWFCLVLSSQLFADPQSSNSGAGVSPQRALLDQYCVACHNQAIVNSATVDGESILFSQLRGLGLTLDTENVDNVAENPEVWGKRECVNCGLG
ncbi:MAG: hypothetical protein Ct9H300mP22_2370 [Gammaproteobacteria bacterium]|nr:MAG: hypothetical protein Ct9H300mP22_2370 [Gammaproteobacteria bacterium]